MKILTQVKKYANVKEAYNAHLVSTKVKLVAREDKKLEDDPHRAR